MRLIDADDLIEFLKMTTITDGITFETGFKQIITDIKNQPTAYDVDKVVGNQLISETLEIVGEYVDDCICTYDFEVFGRSVKMIPVETVHLLLDGIEKEAIAITPKAEPHIDECRSDCEKAYKCKYHNGFTCDNRYRKDDGEHCCCEPKEECRGDEDETKAK